MGLFRTKNNEPVNLLVIVSFGATVAICGAVIYAAFSASKVLGFFYLAVCLSTWQFIYYLIAELLCPGKRIAEPDTVEESPEDAGSESDDLFGSIANAVTALRPSGRVRVGRRRYDAITRGEFIEEGTKVWVLGSKQGMLVVQKPRGKGIFIDRDVEVVDQFAVALDREDYTAAEGVLSSDCVYVSSSGEIRGPGEIVASYKANGDWAASTFDSVRYESSIELPDDERWRITFADHITHKDQSVTYKSHQIVELDHDGLICRIEQAEIPGQREVLEEFFERVGVSRED